MWSHYFKANKRPKPGACSVGRRRLRPPPTSPHPSWRRTEIRGVPAPDPSLSGRGIQIDVVTKQGRRDQAFSGTPLDTPALLNRCLVVSLMADKSGPYFLPQAVKMRDPIFRATRSPPASFEGCILVSQCSPRAFPIERAVIAAYYLFPPSSEIPQRLRYATQSIYST
jgi:hypothetical protein